MRAVLLTGHGGFDRLEVRDDVPVPHPGPGQVLVRVAAAGVNNTDINTRIGWYAPDVMNTTQVDGDAAVPTVRSDVSWAGEVPNFPRIQGADACGRIVAVGTGVDEIRMDERIIVEPVFRDTADPGARPLYFGSEVDGAFAAVHGRAVPTRGARRLPVDRRRTGVDPVLVLGGREHVETHEGG